MKNSMKAVLVAWALIFIALPSAFSAENTEEVTLKIETTPKHAKVFLNDKDIGESPVSIPKLKTKTPYGIKVSLDGYKTWESTVNINQGPTHVYNVDLEKASATPASADANKAVETLSSDEASQFGQIEISSTPSKADVYLDGVLMSKTPMTVKRLLRDKKYSIKIVLKGYKTWESSFNLSEQQSLSIKPDLEVGEGVTKAPAITNNAVKETPKVKPVYGELRLESVPPRAKIFLDDHHVGYAPVIVGKLEQGRVYHLKAELKGYKPWIETIDMTGVKSKTVKMVLIQE